MDKKAAAREDLLNKGKVEDEYLGFINYPPRQLKPSALKIFPAVGMIGPKQTYTTTRHRDERAIKDMPMGLDEFTNNQKYLNKVDTDVFKYKHEAVQCQYWPNF